MLTSYGTDKMYVAMLQDRLNRDLIIGKAGKDAELNREIGHMICSVIPPEDDDDDDDIKFDTATTPHTHSDDFCDDDDG
jgi:hypothetical protein